MMKLLYKASLAPFGFGFIVMLFQHTPLYEAATGSIMVGLMMVTIGPVYVAAFRELFGDVANDIDWMLGSR